MNKNVVRVFAVAGALAAMAMAGCASAPPAEMTSRVQEKVANAAVDDSAITQRIRTQLSESAEVRDRDCGIEIATSGGQVVLSGTAAGRDEIRRALKIALSTPGVRMVRNDIQLRAGENVSPLVEPSGERVVAAAQ